jgi:prolyl-tRNA synthetase
MRLSQMLFVTLHQDPADAVIPSHKLLVRSGMIRRIGSGLYTYMPLMWRVLQKINQIVREEMNATGAQELLMPQLQPAELWQQSGRWDTYTKAEKIMFSLTDRHQVPLGLGPTHEEVITAVARDMIGSYRQLPQTLYQIQTKFRDEIRPRFGLMRGREFIMKDAYSFHADEASLKVTYQAMHDAYCRILTRTGLNFRPVDADSGAIGGSGSQEFMVLAEAGEDEILYTADGQYAANVEKAVALPPEAQTSTFTTFEKRETRKTDTIAKLCKLLDCSPTIVVKNVLYQATYDAGTDAAGTDTGNVAGKTVLVLISLRGDQEVNEVKLQNALTRMASHYGGTTVIDLSVPDADAQAQWATAKLTLGYLSPALPDSLIQPGTVVPQFLRLVDPTAVDLKNFVTGADEWNHHVVGANWGADFALPAQVVDLRKATAGDRAIHDPGQLLQTARGIEIGHIFQLGTKYSAAMAATFDSAQGTKEPLVMGCYGIGVSRLAQAAVEQSYDANGIIWPVAIAPYTAIVVVPNIKDADQMAAAEGIYAELNAAGIDTLLDDRDERAGVKFKDSELIGIPYRIVTGKSLQNGQVELVLRATKAVREVPIGDLVATIRTQMAADLLG